MAAQVASRVNEEFRSAGLSLRGDSMRLVCDFLQQQPDSDEALTQLLQALQANHRAWRARLRRCQEGTQTDSVPCAALPPAQWPAPSSPPTTCVPPWQARQHSQAAARVLVASARVCSLSGAASRLWTRSRCPGSPTTPSGAASTGEWALPPWLPPACCPPLTRRLSRPACANSVAAPPRVLADPDAKASLYRERFHLLAQRLARNPMFGKPALRGVAAASGAAVLELTPLQALLGTTGERRFVLGALSQLEDGRFWLEDATGSCAVDVSGAATSAGLFTENCVVVAEGSLRRDGVFEARALGFPPVEPRGESLKALGPHLDMFGAGTIRCACACVCAGIHARRRTLTALRRGRQEEVVRLQQAEEEGVHEMWVLLSDVYMDQPAVVGALRRVLGAFDAQEVPPSLFVFMGDFCSSPAGASAAGLEASRGVPPVCKCLAIPPPYPLNLYPS